MNFSQFHPYSISLALLPLAPNSPTPFPSAPNLQRPRSQTLQIMSKVTQKLTVSTFNPSEKIGNHPESLTIDSMDDATLQVIDKFGATIPIDITDDATLQVIEIPVNTPIENNDPSPTTDAILRSMLKELTAKTQLSATLNDIVEEEDNRVKDDCTELLEQIKMKLERRNQLKGKGKGKAGQTGQHS